MDRKLRMGMVGGGRGAFIGGVHRMAAQLDGRIQLVCGAFSSDPEKSKASGADLFLPPDRVYTSFEEMAKAEAALPTDKRMDFMTIVTPNNVHYPAAMAALDAGFHVVCDKPMTTSLELAKSLEEKVKQTGLIFCLTHNYTGYQMVKEARALAAGGQLGTIRRVAVEYPQGWVAAGFELTGKKGSGWRTNREQSGSSFTMGDIGTHCANLTEYVTGLKIESLCSDLSSFVTVSDLDDDGNVLLRFDNGARGVLWASGVAIGEENNLSIRVYGSKGSLAWRQEEPNSLVVNWLDRPREIRRSGTPWVGETAKANSWLPSGHPEGFIEGFANIYRNFADAVIDKLEGRPAKERYDFPNVHDGVRGLAFLEAVVGSNKAAEKWVKLAE